MHHDIMNEQYTTTANTDTFSPLIREGDELLVEDVPLSPSSLRSKAEIVLFLDDTDETSPREVLGRVVRRTIDGDYIVETESGRRRFQTEDVLGTVTHNVSADRRRISREFLGKLRRQFMIAS